MAIGPHLALYQKQQLSGGVSGRTEGRLIMTPRVRRVVDDTIVTGQTVLPGSYSEVGGDDNQEDHEK